MWTPLRKEILQICQQLNIPLERLKPVSIHEWVTVKDKVFERFCYPNREGWIWEHLKGDSSAVQFN